MVTAGDLDTPAWLPNSQLTGRAATTVTAPPAATAPPASSVPNATPPPSGETVTIVANVGLAEYVIERSGRLEVIGVGAGCLGLAAGAEVLLTSAASAFISIGATLSVPGTSQQCLVFGRTDQVSWVEVREDRLTGETILTADFTDYRVVLSGGCGSFSAFGAQLLARYRSSVTSGAQLISPSSGQSCTILSISRW